MAALNFLLVFCACAAVDLVWARYIIDVAKKHSRAMLWAAIIPVLGGYAAIEYVRDPWMLVPVALGAVVGTGAGIWRN